MQNNWVVREGARADMWRVARKELNDGNVVVVTTPAGTRTLIPFGGNVVRISLAIPPQSRIRPPVRIG